MFALFEFLGLISYKDEEDWGWEKFQFGFEGVDCFL